MEFKLKNLTDGKITAERIRNTLWLHFNGKIIAVDAQPPSAARIKKSEAGGSNVVRAPMPGKVTKILTSPGNAVDRGQPLAIMEAMKMEYTLKAEIDGIVESVDSVEGEQVALGKILVTLQPKLPKQDQA